MAGVTAKRGPFSEKGTGDAIGRDCALYLLPFFLPSSLPFFLSFFARLVSIVLFERGGQMTLDDDGRTVCSRLFIRHVI